jgi:L-iditol 2-dehydrogenase
LNDPADRQLIHGRNRAAVLHGIRDVRIEDRPLAPPGPGELLLAVTAVGVCGSDVHYYEHGRIGAFVVESPLVLGHEAAGVVVGTGEGTTGHRIGERVAIEPGRPCGHCRMCTSGTYNLCSSMRFLATPPVDGAFTTYLSVDQHRAVGLPDSVSDDAGALLEPLSVGIWAAQRAGMHLGSRALITGAGPIGLCALMVSIAAGAAMTIVVEPAPPRRERAKRLGANFVFAPDDAGLADLAGSIDCFIECSGAPRALVMGLGLLRPRGSAVAVGMSPEGEIAIPMEALQQREITVTGTFRYANTYPLAVELAASGHVPLDLLVDSHYSLEETGSALLAASHDPAVVKAMVLPQGGSASEMAASSLASEKE